MKLKWEDYIEVLCGMFLEIDPEEIDGNTTFEELDIDSIDIVEITMELEEIIGAEIVPESTESITTLKQLFDIANEAESTDNTTEPEKKGGLKGLFGKKK